MTPSITRAFVLGAGQVQALLAPDMIGDSRHRRPRLPGNVARTGPVEAPGSENTEARAKQRRASGGGVKTAGGEAGFHGWLRQGERLIVRSNEQV